MMTEELLPFCKCGCGERVTKKGNCYINGHYWNGKHHSETTREKIRKNHSDTSGENNPMHGRKHSPETIEKIRVALSGENHPMYGKTHSPETITKLSNAKMGHPVSNKTREKIRIGNLGKTLSDKTRDKMRESHLNSDTAKEQVESMRGGNDIVDHHYIYDHSDLSKYTMKMTRSSHARLHKLMQKAGIIVPHINM